MKPTWTKVYRGPGYPVDPKRESERQESFVMNFFFRSPTIQMSLQAWENSMRELSRELSRPADAPEPLSPAQMENFLYRGRTEADSSTKVGHVDFLMRYVDRDARKRRQKEMGALFVKYGITKPTAY